MPGSFTELSQGSGVSNDEERWFVGSPHMASPLELTEADKEFIRFKHAKVTKVEYEGDKWLVHDAADVFNSSSKPRYAHVENFTSYINILHHFFKFVFKILNLVRMFMMLL